MSDYPGEINAFDSLQKFFEMFKGELNIIDEAIDVKLQMEYFKASRKISKKNIDANLVLEQLNLLTNIESTNKKIKDYLIQLAAIDNVTAYRAIETFINEGKPELKHWAMLALQENKMLLQSKLLEQNQVFISTGLGGKGTSLRYFIVLLPNNTDNSGFTDFQQKIISNEFSYCFKASGAEIEDVTFTDIYASLIVLVPMQIALTELFSKTVNECNQFGNFIKNNCIITNVKKLSQEEIFNFLDQDDTINETINSEEFNNKLNTKNNNFDEQKN